ncbi:MAG: DNA mismatch repair protein MutT [bacterium]
MHTEQVWVCPRRIIEDLVGGPAPGFWRGPLDEVIDTAEAAGYFLDRPRAERDESHLQIIPYVLLACRDTYFMVTRLGTQGEARLHGKVSLGMGGHLNPEDGVPPLWGGITRELREEVGLDALSREDLEPLGLILEGRNPVARVHCGIAYRLRVEQPSRVAIHETDKMAGGWAPRDVILTAYPRCETWSQLLIDHCIRTQD